MKAYTVDAATGVTMAPGAVLALTPAQILPRLSVLTDERGRPFVGKDLTDKRNAPSRDPRRIVAKVVAATQFKRGETFGFAGEPSRALSLDLSYEGARETVAVTKVKAVEAGKVAKAMAPKGGTAAAATEKK